MSEIHKGYYCTIFFNLLPHVVHSKYLIVYSKRWSLLIHQRWKQKRKKYLKNHFHLYLVKRSRLLQVKMLTNYKPLMTGEYKCWPITRHQWQVSTDVDQLQATNGRWVQMLTNYKPPMTGEYRYWPITSHWWQVSTDVDQLQAIDDRWVQMLTNYKPLMTGEYMFLNTKEMSVHSIIELF